MKFFTSAFDPRLRREEARHSRIVRWLVALDKQVVEDGLVARGPIDEIISWIAFTRNTKVRRSHKVRERGNYPRVGRDVAHWQDRCCIRVRALVAHAPSGCLSADGTWPHPPRSPWGREVSSERKKACTRPRAVGAALTPCFGDQQTLRGCEGKGEHLVERFGRGRR